MAKCLRPLFLNGNSYNCGSCLNCRINYTSKWQLRLLYELNSWSGAMFVTLTYDDEHVPKDYELKKEHLRNFLKRVRAKLDYNKICLWSDLPIVDSSNREHIPILRYYCAGEYGMNPRDGIKGHERPHFHCILFGLDYYNPQHRQIIIDSWKYCDVNQFDLSRGYKCAIQPVNIDTIGYVTGYVRKKITGEQAINAYGSRIRPFNVGSKGLGLQLALRQKDLLSKGYTYTHNGKRIGVPRYFREKLGFSIDYSTRDKNQDIKNSFAMIYKQYKELYPEPLEINAESKRFERWYDSNKWTISQQIESNFHKREKLLSRSL